MTLRAIIIIFYFSPFFRTDFHPTLYLEYRNKDLIVLLLEKPPLRSLKPTSIPRALDFTLSPPYFAQSLGVRVAHMANERGPSITPCCAIHIWRLVARARWRAPGNDWSSDMLT